MSPDPSPRTTAPLLSPCGMYCGFCGVYQATRDRDEKLKEKLAPFFGCSPEQVQCGGCLSDKRFFFCASCAIRDCATGKGLEGCHQCDEFPCAHVEEFPVKPGRKMILASIPRWRQLGTEAWLAEERLRHTCPACGARFIRGATRCPQCKQELTAP